MGDRLRLLRQRLFDIGQPGLRLNSLLLGAVKLVLGLGQPLS